MNLLDGEGLINRIINDVYSFSLIFKHPQAKILFKNVESNFLAESEGGRTSFEVEDVYFS